MHTLLIAENKEKIKEIIFDILNKTGNLNINIVKLENTIKIMEVQDCKALVTLKDKIIELEEALYYEKKGVLYKTILEIIERPLIEQVLKRTEGNQLKAARILGINRNTMRVKIRKIKIDVEKWKII